MFLDKLWPSASVLEWLQIILYERFGQPFVLNLEEPDRVAMRLVGVAGIIYFKIDENAFNRGDSDFPCDTWDPRTEKWKSATGLPLPVPGCIERIVPLIQFSESGCQVNFDILGFVFWMLSRREELNRSDLDEHGRFPAIASHAYKNNYLERPVIDEWLLILRQVICRTWLGIQLKQSKFAVQLSHDVDRPSRYVFGGQSDFIRSLIGDVIKRKDISSIVKGPLARYFGGGGISKFDPFNKFDWIMKKSEAKGVRSAFYFIAGNTDNKRDANYNLADARIRGLMKQIHFRGHEIGLHPSYNTYIDSYSLNSEAERLRNICSEERICQDIWGGRMHYLRWKSSVTLALLDKAGQQYDATLGYADIPGFRCGTCFEYPGFDFEKKRHLDIRIRPLISMECSVSSPLYLGLGFGDLAFQKFNSLKTSCKSVGGVYSLLWHNSELVTGEQMNLYEEILNS